MRLGYLRERAGELPLEVTGFVGRAQELREIGALLGKARLVSLTGPAGVGKTRLALRAARTAQPYYPDRTCFVELSSLHDPVLLPHTVAAALGLSEQGDRDPVGLLLSYLAEKRLLLVLDTCEHLLDACAMLVDLLLRRAPGATVLATSRQALDAPGEFALPIRPLPTDHEAVQLFAERAAAVVPGFALTEANHDDVVSVCRSLEGMPLAVELAVVRLRALSLGELADRLQGRLQALTGCRRAAGPGHHRTLRATLDWSHDLCTPQERLLWRRLAVFAGDFDVAAAEAVCGGGELPSDAVLEPLIGLIDKSVLLRVDAQPSRYRLLDTLREYAAERLAASGEEDTYRMQHLTHLERLAYRADSHFHCDEQVRLLNGVGQRLQDFRVALDYAIGSSSPQLALRGLALATRLWTHWVTAGRFQEGVRWLRDALAQVEYECPERVEALHRLSWMLMILGRYDEAEPCILQSLAMAQEIGDKHGAAYAIQYRGALALVRLQLRSAHRDFDEARRRFRELGDLDGLAIAAFEQAFGAALAGDVEHAWEVSGEGLDALASVPGECWTRSYCLLYRQLALWQSRDREADTSGPARARAADRAVERDRLGREVLALKQAVDDRLGAGIAMELLAWSAAESGRFERAAWLLGAARTLWDKIGCALFGVEPLQAEQRAAAATARAALGDGIYQRLYARGATLDLTQAVTYAVRDTDVLAVPDTDLLPEAGTDLGDEQSATADPAVPRARDRAAAARPGRLTNREREVAALVAERLTNREIAERLVVSKRTVDAHVEHILNKLGLTSRTQITGLEQ
ncbi:LuxR C-terminal-related transcriptional regulator [Streptomyces sp. E11-3]|uniref:LuxR C-terminal-related transcriptional regulator n=1 Tax=Streptomyces sp. E11-3 TaxID=3110112 RepID=UPI00397F692A